MSTNMGPAPVNLKLAAPTVKVKDWNQQAQDWVGLNTQANGNPNFHPLTIKAAYVIGVIHDLCASADWLLRHARARQTTYLPAYGVFASGVELLGRCLNGNPDTRNSVADLRTGLKWLTLPSRPRPFTCSSILVTTSTDAYTLDELAQLRHFAAHGQAASKSKFSSLDYEILEKLGPLMGDALERYWHILLNKRSACNKLAHANVIALREWPVLNLWRRLQGTAQTGYQSIPQIFARFQWTV